jgi:hypothetical protein
LNIRRSSTDGPQLATFKQHGALLTALLDNFVDDMRGANSLDATVIRTIADEVNHRVDDTFNTIDRAFAQLGTEL